MKLMVGFRDQMDVMCRMESVMKPQTGGRARGFSRLEAMRCTFVGLLEFQPASPSPFHVAFEL